MKNKNVKIKAFFKVCAGLSKSNRITSKLLHLAKVKSSGFFLFTLDQKVGSGVTPSEYIYHCPLFAFGGYIFTACDCK